VELKIGDLCPLLQVFDMPTSIAFYRDVLGFEVASPVPEGDECDWALLTLNGSELMLNTAYEADHRPPVPDPARIAAHGDTALFFDCPNVDAAYEYIRGRGISVSGPVVRDYGMKQLYLSDPDGYEICFQCRVNQGRARLNESLNASTPDSR
jgi:glyoxylase I family protein